MPLSPDADFERELEIFRKEAQSATQFFYSWQTIHAVAGTNKQVLGAVNRNPLFWRTSLGAFQTSTFIVLGRIFDPDTRNHSVSRLLLLAHKHPDIFSKQALAERKRRSSSGADGWLPEYLKTVYEPSSEDFRRVKGHVAKRRKIYEQNYKDLRHTVFAHTAVTDQAKLDALFAKTNIREIQRVLVFLGQLYEAMWQLLWNGRKPTLRPARYSVSRMREVPSPKHRQKLVQEQIIHETEAVLKSLAAV